MLLGDGAGGFARQGLGAGGYSVAVGDFNGDQQPDLAFDGSLVLLGDGRGGFAPELDFDSAGVRVAVAELNGDKRPDRIVVNAELSRSPGHAASVETLATHIGAIRPAIASAANMLAGNLGRNMLYFDRRPSVGSRVAPGAQRRACLIRS